jgi:hypothetical protein
MPGLAWGGNVSGVPVDPVPGTVQEATRMSNEWREAR